MADKNVIHSPVTPIARPPADNKGGPGTYDGEKGYPPRSGGHGGVPEKVREEK